MSQDLDYHDSDMLETVDDVILFAFKFVKYFNQLSKYAPNGPEILLQTARLVWPVVPAGAVAPVVPVVPVVPVASAGSAEPVGPVAPAGAVAPVGLAEPVVPEAPVELAGAAESVGPVVPAGAVAPVGLAEPVVPEAPVASAGSAEPVGPVVPAGAVAPVGLAEPVVPEAPVASVWLAEQVVQLGYHDVLAELLTYIRRPMDLMESLKLGSLGNTCQVKEIQTLFRVLLFFEIQPKEALERICTNPYGYLTALKEVFAELRTGRPLTIEEDIIIAFRKYKVSWDTAQQVLNLKNATLRKLWKNAVKQAMARTLEKVKQERAERAARGEGYHHLSLGERTFITYARILGLPQKRIAECLGRNPSTISREVRRLDPDAYGPHADYSHSRACDDYVKKRRNCGRKNKLELRDSEGKLLTSHIRDFIVHQKLSPEQIVFGKFKKMENIDSYPSKSSVYNWINSGKIYGLSRENLRHKGKKRKKYYDSCKKYEKGTSILERPDFINDRSEFGHFEADSVVSSRNGKGRVFTLVERKTRFFIGKVVVEGTADKFVDFIKKTIKKYGNVIKSITVDNGTEFAGWEELERMGIKIYFARPYCSNDKGCIEHHNGLLREFFPKKTDFSQVHQKTLDMKCLRLINKRPRKVLEWQSPQELFEHEIQLARQATSA